LKYIVSIILASIITLNLNSQFFFEQHTKNIKESQLLQDTLPKKTTPKKNIGAIFLGIGGGLSLPTAGFTENSDVSFGALGRMEYSSTSVFPFVIGAEVTYFSYNGADLFKSSNELGNFKTKIFSYGLSVEYSLTKILQSSFTMPFLTVDVKNNSITREYDDDTTLTDLPRSASNFSVGLGFGLTMFIFDFHFKYNYLKDNTNIGVYVKTKFPIIKF